MLASAVITRVRTVLMDEDGERWPINEMLTYINAALIDIPNRKPTATSKTVPLALEEGTLQAVPETYLSMMRVTRNLKSTDTPLVGIGSITATDRETLDGQLPEWHDPSYVPYNSIVEHFLHDEADPYAFYVYPGNDGTGIVEIVVSAYLTPISIEFADLAALQAHASDTIALRDIYSEALSDYVLYRCLLKDSQFAGSAQRAQMHYQLYTAALGNRQTIEMAANVNTTQRTA